MAEEITLNDLDPRLQKQVQAAEKAANSGNAQYAIDICMDILKRHPGCLDVRKVLHEARGRKSGSKSSKGMTRFLTKVTSAPFSMKAKSQIEKDPAGVMQQAEQLLNSNPVNFVALKNLGEAAEAMELWKTAAFVLEEARRLEPQDPEVLSALGNAYVKSGDPQKAINLCARILQNDPGNEKAQDLMRRASVAQTMEKGKWEQEGDFRDKIKDTEEAEKLEQQSRVANDEDTLRKMIADTEKKLEEEPENIGYYRQLANWHRKLNEYDKALEWIRKAREFPAGAGDTTLERLAVDLQVSAMRKAVQDKEKELEKDPDNKELQQEVERRRDELLQTRLQNVAALVEKYPNDYGYRYEYGELLLESQDYDKAIQQFQLAQRNPKVRINALLNLGRAFKAKKIYDLAVEQLESAKKELPTMNDLKKDITYELANVYEQMGKQDEAIGEYKLIYSADIGYRDVADKINKFYEQQA